MAPATRAWTWSVEMLGISNAGLFERSHHRDAVPLGQVEHADHDGRPDHRDEHPGSSAATA